MSRSLLEGRAIQIIDRVVKHQPVEDDHVELKAEWPEVLDRAARQIAAHANTARGDPVTWLIGVCEKRGLVGAGDREPSTWWAGIRKHLGEVPPDLLHQINLPIDGKTVAILQWATDRAPYLWRNPQHGAPGHSILWEVPWREASGARSATRADLLRMLVPAIAMPQMQMTRLSVRVAPNTGDAGAWWWIIEAGFYVQPRSRELVVLPLHRSALWLRFANDFVMRLDHLQPSTPSSSLSRPTIEVTYDQINIHGPGSFSLLVNMKTDVMAELIGAPVELHLEVQPALSDLAIKMGVVAAPIDPESPEVGRWRLDRGLTARLERDPSQ